MAQIQIPLFTVCSVWSRLYRMPPKSADLTRGVMRSFRSLFGNVTSTDWVCGTVDQDMVREAATRTLRAQKGMTTQYEIAGHAKAIDDAQGACNYMAAVWLCTCDEPPDQNLFTEHVQSLFPKIDSLEIARHAARICIEDMPTIYETWFDQHMNVVKRWFEPVVGTRKGFVKRFSTAAVR